jgi:hypothetical protein
MRENRVFSIKSKVTCIEADEVFLKEPPFFILQGLFSIDCLLAGLLPAESAESKNKRHLTDLS